MWTLLVLFLFTSHGVQGADRSQADDPRGSNVSSAIDCGGYLFGSSGTFYSPNYPNHYPKSINCTWYIRPGSRVVKLDLTDVDIEVHPRCIYDAVYVHDGPSIDSRIIGKVCGNSSRTFYSTGSYLTVHFTSDGVITRTGFRADYQVVGSCRNNCGYYVGNCSCSSSCGYRGNCCPDYEDYCQTTTTSWPSVSTDQPSCLYKCGHHMGSCSCSSSCEYHGNCCYDYHYYCQLTTEMPATEMSEKPCGGSLFGSGTISSPNYPNHYQDNTYCVWQLRAAYDQRIFLSFTYLQLENCCTCDYISVYDGPTVGSPYMGKVCNNSLGSFYSSSNYMTVRFRTDGSVVGRGFSADFTSSLSPSSGKVDCASDYMNIVIQKSYLNSLGYDGNSLYLNDPHCRPRISSYQVVFRFSITSCGNVKKFEHGRVVYTNTLRAYTASSGEITHQSHLKLNVACRMQQDSVSEIMYVVRHHNDSSLTGTGRFNTTMRFYTLNNFHHVVTQDPYEVTLNQNMYVQVSQWRYDSSLVVFLDTCVTSPSPYDFHTRAHYLVRNGCTVDNTYYPYLTGTHGFARFTFKAFQFLRATESVYIQCKVQLCQASDYTSRCRRGCMRRTARDLSSEHDSETLVLGPIRLKDPEKKEEETQTQDKP